MRLKITNNWENLYWHIGEIEVTAALRKITLEFPDGTVETFNVKWTMHSQSYSDMGHTYAADQYNAFIKLKINGILLKTNLGDITKKRNVKILDFKVRRP